MSRQPGPDDAVERILGQSNERVCMCVSNEQKTSVEEASGKRTGEGRATFDVAVDDGPGVSQKKSVGGVSVDKSEPPSRCLIRRDNGRSWDAITEIRLCERFPKSHPPSLGLQPRRRTSLVVHPWTFCDDGFLSWMLRPNCLVCCTDPGWLVLRRPVHHDNPFNINFRKLAWVSKQPTVTYTNLSFPREP